jgi:dihydrofolate reductase
MGSVYAGASMSLDGYISGPGETGFEHLFAWMEGGEVEIPTADPNMTMHATTVGAEIFKRMMDETGAIVVGRHLFDITNGWGGTHPMGCPVVVLTHDPPEDFSSPQFHFVSTGIEDAVAKAMELAGDKDVGINGGEMTRQCLEAGLLDGVQIDLVPVLLGGGQKLFPEVAGAPILLEQETITPDTKAVHLRYRILK